MYEYSIVSLDKQKENVQLDKMDGLFMKEGECRKCYQSIGTAFITILPEEYG